MGRDGPAFYRHLLDSLSDHIAVVDATGVIVYVNESWRQFFCRNTSEDDVAWSGVNYLQVCRQSAELGDDYGRQAFVGIEAVIGQQKKHFYLEYPCHSPKVKRWFMMRVSPLIGNEQSAFVISHQDITERKLIEEQVLLQSRTDSLTSLANRREFDLYLSREWRRCCRAESTIAILLMDLDHFKRLNDVWGHQAGDECLRNLGRVLMACASRSEELCARYGGEEFVVVMGNTSFAAAKNMADRIQFALQQRALPHPDGVVDYVSASIGLAVLTPVRGEEEDMLLQYADEALYRAKHNGRNRIESYFRDVQAKAH